jgi:hypothetical protein
MTAQPAEQTGTDVARIDTSQALTLRASMDYAQALAQSNMLPAQFRKQPANVLWAMEYGRTIGLTPMAAITGVHVIEGKPSASAGLISGLVRRAGHKLRIKGDARAATCTIIRSDDPSEPFVVTFTIDDAKTAGLLNKDVWKRYPSSMLKARAISQCARDACEEVLFGLHYTPEELGAEVDEEGLIVTETVATVTPLRDGPTAAEIAQMAAESDDPASIRAAYTDASTRGLLDEDVTDQIGMRAAALGLTAESLTLRGWLTFCGKHAKDTGMSVNDADGGDDEAEVIEDDEALPPGGLTPQGEQAQAELGL